MLQILFQLFHTVKRKLVRDLFANLQETLLIEAQLFSVHRSLPTVRDIVRTIRRGMELQFKFVLLDSMKEPDQSRIQAFDSKGYNNLEKVVWFNHMAIFVFFSRKKLITFCYRLSID